MLDQHGSLIWKNERGLTHREKGPAFITTYGYMEYCFNSLIHRSNGPARIWPDADAEYYFNGTPYSKKYYWNIINAKTKKK